MIVSRVLRLETHDLAQQTCVPIAAPVFRGVASRVLDFAIIVASAEMAEATTSRTLRFPRSRRHVEHLKGRMVR
jgi:hypothetical protein